MQHTDTVTHFAIKRFFPDVQIEKMSVPSLRIAPCTGCDECAHENGCIIDDDMQTVYEKLSTADIVLVTSPLYFGGVSAQIKVLIDRCQAIYMGKKTNRPLISHKKREGYFICTAGSAHANFEGACITVQLFFETINADYQGHILLDNTDNRPAKDALTTNLHFTLEA